MTAPSLPASCNIPDMQSAVEADLKQLQLIFAIHRRMDPVIDTTEIAKEIGARIREELDYRREAKHVALYRAMLDGIDTIRVPKVWPELSTGRLLTLDWLEGRRLLDHKGDDLATRNRIGKAMFTAWWWTFSRFGVIHGDPHLGNYSVFAEGSGSRRKPAGINLLDYGCIRIFPPKFVRRRGRSLQRAAHRRPRSRGARLRDLGLQAALARIDRHPQHLGALHLRAAAGGPRAHPGGRREARRVRPARSVPRAPGAQAARAR